MWHPNSSLSLFLHPSFPRRPFLRDGKALLRTVNRASGSKLPRSLELIAWLRGVAWRGKRPQTCQGLGFKSQHPPLDGWETLSKSLYTSRLQFFTRSRFWGGASKRWIWWCTENTAWCFCFYYYSMRLAYEIQTRSHCIGLANTLLWGLQIQKQWGSERCQYCGEKGWVWDRIGDSGDSVLGYGTGLAPKGLDQDGAPAERWRNEAAEVAECLTSKKVQIFFMWNLQVFKCWRKTKNQGTSLVAQWLGLCAPNAGGLGSIPHQGTGSHMRAVTGSSHATTKEPMSLNWGARLLQLRPGTAK